MSAAHRRSVAYSQNFLRSRRLVVHLLEESSILPEDVVIEVGPGRGAITAPLAARCGQVLAVEKDPDLADQLQRRFAQVPNVAVFAADFLPFPLPVTRYKVFASIPFNVTTAIVAKLTSGTSPPVDAYLVVQREAAAKLLGDPLQSLSAVLLQPWFEPTLVHHFRPTDFVPVPRVDAVLLRLRRREAPLVAPGDAPLFRDLVVAGFTAWQPTLRQALTQTLGEAASASLARTVPFDLLRPPTATPFAAWLALFAAFRDLADARASRAIRGLEARLRLRQAGLDKVHRTRTPRRPA